MPDAFQVLICPVVVLRNTSDSWLRSGQFPERETSGKLPSMQLGYVPGSPIPNRKRIMIKETSPMAKPVKAVKRDQNKTMRINNALSPIRSPQTPEGISMSA